MQATTTSSDPEPPSEVPNAGGGGAAAQAAAGAGATTGAFSSSSTTSNNSSGGSFERDPVTYLTLVVTSKAGPSSSREQLQKLGGPVASVVCSKARTSTNNIGGGGGLPSDVAFLYLQAVANHLPHGTAFAASSPRDVTTEGGARSVLSTGASSSLPMTLFNPFEAFSSAHAPPNNKSRNDPTESAAGGGGDNSSNNAGGSGWFPRGWGTTSGDDADAAQPPSWTVTNSFTDATNAILEAVGYAAACCQPRSLVVQSGILPVLAQMLPHTPSDRASLRDAAANAAANASAPSSRRRDRVALVPLTVVQVEFLQACIYGQQYHYAEDAVSGHWPRPVHPSVPVHLVLRYYYLRGTIHIGTGNWTMARRCFWTCLSIPADDVVSAIAVASWKKLVLVQCRTMLLEARNHKSSHPLNLPRAVPVSFNRFLSDALSHSPLSRTTSSSSASASQLALDAAALSSGARGGGRSLRYDEMEDYPEATMRMVEGSDSDGPTDPSQRGGAGGRGGAAAAVERGVRPYGDLVTAYSNLDATRFQTIMGEHEGVFRRDGNLGLVRQCWEQLLRRQVVFWSRVYTSIALPDLAAAVKVSVDKLSSILLGLSSELSWSIEVRDGVVNFPLAPRSAHSALPSPDELIQLAQLAQELDASIEASSSYASLTKRMGVSVRSETIQGAGSLGTEEMHVEPTL